MEPTIAFNAALLSEGAQISMVGIGTLAEVLKEAKELVQTPGEQFRSSMCLFDPTTQDYAVLGSPDYNWTPYDNSAELAKAQPYLTALQTTLKALNREIRRVRLCVNAVQDYINRLNDYEQQLFQVVPKKLPLSVNKIQEEAA